MAHEITAPALARPDLLSFANRSFLSSRPNEKRKHRELDTRPLIDSSLGRVIKYYQLITLIDREVSKLMFRVLTLGQGGGQLKWPMNVINSFDNT